MRKIIAVLMVLMLTASTSFAADQWDKTEPDGSQSVSDIDTLIQTNNEALDRALANYRRGCKLAYNSSTTIDVGSGEIVCSNSAGSVRRLRKNDSSISLDFSNNLDTGSEAPSTTYYVYAVADTDIEGFTGLISTSSSAPNGATYYKKLGSFYNDSGSDITETDVSNDVDTYSKSFGDWDTSSYSNDTAYQASTDGFVVARGTGSKQGPIGYTDGSNPPTTLRAYFYADTSVNGTITMPVRAGDYWKTEHADVFVYWIPLD